jgi:PKD repeat protein
MSIQPNTGSTNPAAGNPGTFLIGDVGYYTWEEIDVLAAAGLNCGWPLFEGQTSEPDYATRTTVNQDEGQQFKNLCSQPTSFAINSQVTNRRFTHYRPAVAWKHDINETRVPYFNGTTPTNPLIGAANSPTTGQSFAGNCAIGGVYYTGNAFGSTYQNTYFFGDYGTNIIKVANVNSAQPWFSKISNFAPPNFTNGIVDMEQNPLDNSILYVNINTGQIMKISLAGNQPPVVAISSNKISGASPLTVSFSSSGSIDPDGGSLKYLWDFGDGTTSTQANPTHTFSGTGILSFTVTLTVTDPTSLSSSKSLHISINNTPPTAKIISPVNNSLYSILNATQVQLAATVTDNETIAGMQYAWEVVLRHNNHEHREPAVNDPSPSVQISPVGCDGENYYYMIQLTVTDSGGSTATDSVKIYPDCSTGGLSVSNLIATSQIGSVLLTWSNPFGSFDEIMVAAKAAKGFLTNPSGTNYIASSDFNGTGTLFEGGKIVYKSNGQSVTVSHLVPGAKYYFRVFTRVGNSWTGGIETSATVLRNLTGAVDTSFASVNLTAEGSSDWAHWPGYDHKLSGGSKVSNYTVVGGGTVSNYNNDLRICSWSDGAPMPIGVNKNGISISGIGKGFQITVPADPTQRTLKLYVGGSKSRGTLTASLSDGSAPNYVNSSFSGTGQYNGVYTLTYKAASARKLITVKWVQVSGTGNVTLQAATLVENTLASNNAADSTGNQSDQNSLTIFPNPFNDNLVIRYSGKEIGSGVIFVYTPEMRLVAKYPFEKTALNVNKQITPKDLINGLYILEFRIGQTKIIRKLVRLE